MKKLFLFSAALVLLGAGCTWPQNLPGSFLVQNSSKTTSLAKTNADAIVLHSGAVIGMTTAGRLAHSVSDARIETAVVSWQENDRAKFSWQRVENHESDASVNARVAFQNHLLPSPVGVPEKEPAPIYEKVTATGMLTVQNLRDSQVIVPPAFWPVGDMVVNNNSVFILSQKVFDALTQTKKSVWHPGIFENQFSAPLAVSETVVNDIGALFEKQQKQKDRDVLTADKSYTTFLLIVNGEKKDVTAIAVHDLTADYLVLDNAKYPLVLKMTFNPQTGDSLGTLFSYSSLKTAASYEVTDITE